MGSARVPGGDGSRPGARPTIRPSPWARGPPYSGLRQGRRRRRAHARAVLRGPWNAGTSEAGRGGAEEVRCGSVSGDGAAMRLAPRVLCNAAQAAWRENFLLRGLDVARWFPGHMAKGLKKMKSSLKLVDCIIEVHDARISFHRAGEAPLPEETLGLKPHLLVLNKMDLADLTEQQIIPMVTELMGSSPRYHRGENLEYCLMVIGVPNVGKSSLINSLRRQHLRKGKATRVGGEPGITRAVMSRIQVSERPLMFLLDTPGVLAPRIESVETGLKLALCGTVLDHLVGEETMADYLLFTLNRHQRFGYVQHYGLGSACDNIERVLKSVAVKLGKTQKVKVLTGTGDVNVIQPDYPAAARDFLHTFRRGLLGPVMLDLDVLRGHPPAETVP
ncbi:hypothetical protein H8959_011487 [Pygathrix nigripes]